MHHDYMLGIAIDDDVWVVRHYDDLSLLFHLVEGLDKEIGYQLIIQVVFRLIEYEGRVAA